ncbi:unnamed protein product [Rhizophagus irregularis]|nr:unnamed protein product [Rhizophagus irregularis]
MNWSINNLINGFPKQKNKKIDKDKKGKRKEKKKKDKKVLKKVEFERPSKEVEFERISKEVQHKSQELKKTLTKFVDNKVAKVADVAVVNDDLPEKFSRFSKNFKRKCKNKPKHKKMPDGMCWNGVDCRRKFCQFEHPSIKQCSRIHIELEIPFCTFFLVFDHWEWDNSYCGVKCIY